jgi:hypothetical protein
MYLNCMMIHWLTNLKSTLCTYVSLASLLIIKISVSNFMAECCYLINCRFCVQSASVTEFCIWSLPGSWRLNFKLSTISIKNRINERIQIVADTWMPLRFILFIRCTRPIANCRRNIMGSDPVWLWGWTVECSALVKSWCWLTDTRITHTLRLHVRWRP